jgi:hypothetical protein
MRIWLNEQDNLLFIYKYNIELRSGMVGIGLDRGDLQTS